MLRYRADLRTLIFVSIYFGLVAIGWTSFPFGTFGAGFPWGSVPLFAAVCVFSFFGAVATHNTVHSPMFTNRTMNRLFQIVLTLTYGNPVSSYVPGHNLSHHKYTQSRRDVMRTTKTRHRWHLLNGLFFILHVAGAILKGDQRYFKAMFKRNPPWARQMALEWLLLHGTYVALAIVDWKKFLFWVFLPHKYAAWGIITMNLLQHDGCDENSEWNHSRNFVGRFVNFWTYNNGFHTIHHMQPGLHWSLAPAAHARLVAPHIHPNLDQTNFLAYLFRTFGFPGKRLTYDGKPLVLPEEGPDEEWVPGPKETPPDVSLGAIA